MAAAPRASVTIDTGFKTYLDGKEIAPEELAAAQIDHPRRRPRRPAQRLPQGPPRSQGQPLRTRHRRHQRGRRRPDPHSRTRRSPPNHEDPTRRPAAKRSALASTRADLRELQRQLAAPPSQELQAFLRELKGKSPQEMLGVVAASHLVRSLVLSTVLVAGAILLFTAIPYFLAERERGTRRSDRRASQPPLRPPRRRRSQPRPRRHPSPIRSRPSASARNSPPRPTKTPSRTRATTS